MRFITSQIDTAPKLLVATLFPNFSFITSQIDTAPKLFREKPTASEVLEEVYHFKQHKRGDYAEYESEEMVARREIDAQKYLIEVAKRYNIPESETEQTRKALREYKRKLEELVRRNREG